MALKLKGSTSGFVGLDAPSVAGNNTLILPENSGSAFQLFANDITAGVTTFTTVTVNRNGDLTVPGTISIGGTLTYEDVTSVDSIGIVTARGLSIFGDTTGLNVTGVSTFTDNLTITGTAPKIIFTDTNNDSDYRIIVNDGAFKIQDTTNSNAVRLSINSAGNATFTGDVSIADKIIHDGDTNTAIRFPAADTITAETAGSERLRITSTGLIGIGTDNPLSGAAGARVNIYFEDQTTYDSTTNRANGLIINNQASGGYSSLELAQRTTSGNTYGSAIINAVDPQDGNTYGADLTFQTRATGSGNYGERMRITAAGQVLIGTGTARAVGGESNPRLHIEGSGNTSNSWVNITRFQAGTGAPNLQFGKARSNTAGTYTIVQDDDNLGQISFLGADGTDLANYAAVIRAQVDGTPASNNIPGRLVFETASGGTNSEKMRIASDGKVKIGSGDASLALLHIAPALYSINLQNDSNNKSRIIFSKNSVGNDSRGWIEGNGEINGYIGLAAADAERVRVQGGGLKLFGGSYIMDVAAGYGAPNNNSKQMDQRRWMWYGTSSSTHTVARVARASSGQPGDGDSRLAAFIVTYTTRSMYGFDSDSGYSVMKMRTGRISGNTDNVYFSTEKDTMGTGSGSQNPTIVLTDEGSGVVRIDITNPSSTHSFGEINLMTYDCRITLPTG